MAAKHLKLAAKFGPSAGLTAYMAAPISKQYPLYGELKAKRTEKTRLTHYCNTFGISNTTKFVPEALVENTGTDIAALVAAAVKAALGGILTPEEVEVKVAVPTMFKVRGVLDTDKYDGLSEAQAVAVIKAQYAAGQKWATGRS